MFITLAIVLLVVLTYKKLRRCHQKKKIKEAQNSAKSKSIQKPNNQCPNSHLARWSALCRSGTNLPTNKYASNANQPPSA